ncbi:hypothetical protein Pstr01_29400 [Pseudomonas straminea]|uniref:Cation/multidrug efflux pump n=1 Tax=Pseudomonas straminea TaxID=47882 RepID=A0A1I1WFG1_PSEOC|nr:MULTISPECIES: hypothetical protein [Pseudomonas]TWE07074.1 hypothetical protein FB481_104156 [Pseudomonas sp. AG1028]GLX14701.1 hypothetical protein Pstr01_29400 [Pseudomonas straminea]SFD91830.1 hypothetical protein SAMN05216372_105338 [Pseudomonas straminea]
MQYDALAWATALLALLVLFIALRILFGGRWFLAWLRGTSGLIFLAASALVGLVAYDLSRYEPLPANKPLLTLSFHRTANVYQVDILENGVQRSVNLEGDLWQLDVRLLQWKGLAALIGLEPGYRLEKINSRFLSIEQQNQARYTQAELTSSLYGVDLWRWLRLGQHDLFMFDAQARRVTYLPMADQAVFNVSLTPTGLLAQPMNEAAHQALKDWQ